MDTEETTVMKHLLSTLKRTMACEKAEGDYISSLIDKEVVKRELHWTANMLRAYKQGLCQDEDLCQSKQHREETSHWTGDQWYQIRKAEV